MKKFICVFLIICFCLVPFSAFAEDTVTNVETVKSNIVSNWNNTLSMTINTSKIQTVLYDESTNIYYFTLANVSNRDKCEIKVINGQYCLYNGGYYYSGDWSGSFWCKMQNNTISVLTNYYVAILNDSGTSVNSWNSVNTVWNILSNSYTYTDKGFSTTKSFNSVVGSPSLNPYSDSNGNIVYHAILPSPENIKVLQLGNYYSQSIFAYCFNQLNGDYDISTINVKLDLIVQALDDLLNSNLSLSSTLTYIYNAISQYFSIFNSNMVGTNNILSRIEAYLSKINSYFTNDEGNYLFYLLEDIDRLLTNFFYQMSGNIDNAYDWDYSAFVGADVVLQKLNDFLDDLVETATQKEDSNAYSTSISTLTSDSNTIFGASSQLAGQINDFLGTIDGKGTTTIDVGYSAKLVGVPINDKLSISNSWWTPYKPTADAIVSAFLWLTFLFQFFGQLGNILEGNGFRITIHRTHYNPEHYDANMEE